MFRVFCATDPVAWLAQLRNTPKPKTHFVMSQQTRSFAPSSFQHWGSSRLNKDSCQHMQRGGSVCGADLFAFELHDQRWAELLLHFFFVAKLVFRKLTGKPHSPLLSNLTDLLSHGPYFVNVWSILTAEFLTCSYCFRSLNCVVRPVLATSGGVSSTLHWSLLQ